MAQTIRRQVTVKKWYKKSFILVKMVLIGPQKVIRNNSPRSRWSNRENWDLN